MHHDPLTANEQVLFNKIADLLAQTEPIAQVLSNYDLGDSRWWQGDTYTDKRGTVWKYNALVAHYWEIWAAVGAITQTLNDSIHTRQQGSRYNQTIQAVWERIIEVAHV